MIKIARGLTVIFSKARPHWSLDICDVELIIRPIMNYMSKCVMSVEC